MLSLDWFRSQRGSTWEDTNATETLFTVSTVEEPSRGSFLLPGPGHYAVRNDHGIH